jgi:tRNA-splicing ligase RtcB
MSEPNVAIWLAEPLPRSVAQSIERLATSEDVARIAVMPDVHLSGEVCVGLAVATCRLIYPAAVGGDIGCGMAAIACDADASKLADASVAERLLSELGRCVPAMRHSRATLPALPDPLSQASLSDPRLMKVVARDASAVRDARPGQPFSGVPGGLGGPPLDHAP